MAIEVLEQLTSKSPDETREQFATDILTGFTAAKKYIPSKYFYDSEGSLLFEKITDLEEYYPTRCETEIFQTCKSDISQRIDDSFNLIELGAGDGRKTKILLEEFCKNKIQFEYLPIDISQSAVENLDSKMGQLFPQLKVTGVVGEYMNSIDWILQHRTGKNLVLFLGSNIGNFDQESATVFLRVLWKHLNDGDKLLIGFDLKKDISLLTRAYNDSKGVTKEFNLNILRRLNRELGANFDTDKFMHYGVYNPVIGAMESYLISTEDQTVQIAALEKSFRFRAFEPIHLEYSNKYLLHDIDELARETGFVVETNYFDEKRHYVDSLWTVKKESL